MIHPPSDAVRLYLQQLRQNELEQEATRMRLARQAAAPGAMARVGARAIQIFRLAGNRTGVDQCPAAPRQGWRIALITERR